MTDYAMNNIVRADQRTNGIISDRFKFVTKQEQSLRDNDSYDCFLNAGQMNLSLLRLSHLYHTLNLVSTHCKYHELEQEFDKGRCCTKYYANVSHPHNP